MNVGPPNRAMPRTAKLDSRASLPGVAWGVLGVLLVVCYWPMLVVTARFLVGGDDMAHGFFAPIIAVYVFWQERKKINLASAQPNSWGLLLVTMAAFLSVIATLGGSSTFSRFGLLVSLAGCILIVAGFSGLRTLWFPLFLLLFTFPIPAVLYGELTLPLQLLATRLSELSFEMLGFSVVREGNVLELANQRLSVVEACSGLRSLVTLTFFSLVYAYFFEHRRWLKVCVTLGALPAAILMNVARITTTGLLGRYHPTWTQGAYHEMLGWLCFSVGAVLVIGSHQLLRRTCHG